MRIALSINKRRFSVLFCQRKSISPASSSAFHLSKCHNSASGENVWRTSGFYKWQDCGASMGVSCEASGVWFEEVDDLVEDGGESQLVQGVRQAGAPAPPAELWKPVSLLSFREKHRIKYATGPTGTLYKQSIILWACVHFNLKSGFPKTMFFIDFHINYIFISLAIMWPILIWNVLCH